MMSKLFKGANVFMSRNLVPPEVFDALHDALKNNGADIFLCCDPARNGPDDYHVISSSDHEKFSDLQSKGCRLLGPQCVLSCAKECRPLPKHCFACCLAMDGVKVLASGFDSNEKAEIGKMVASMGGTLYSKASLDVNFVIVKDVLAAKYKWALNVLKKPIITISWLHQCWKEHRVVPQEAFKVPPFSGLTICVSRIPADERKEVEKLVRENGGKYSAELTKSCTHLICDIPEGDKYKVAKRWGCIHIVTRKWFDQSVARKASMNEASYPVQYVPAVSASGAKTSSLVQRNPVNSTGNFPSASVAEDSNFEAISSAGTAEPDLEANLSQKVVYPTTLGASSQEKNGGTPTVDCNNDMNLDGCIADDSQNENDLYLSECQISLVGFSASEMRKLVNMVRRGGGSRYMSLNERLTHIVVGTPTDTDRKDIRSLAAMGIIYVVRNSWLVECDREKKEVPVLQRHIANDVLFPKDQSHTIREYMAGPTNMEQGKPPFNSLPIEPNVQSQTILASSEKSLEKKVTKVNMNGDNSSKRSSRTSNQSQIPENGHQQERSSTQIQDKKSNVVFEGMTFCFGSSFPLDRRGEINDWVHEGGGLTLCDNTEQDVNFIIQCHGMVSHQTNTSSSRGINVSSHWIKSCLEDEQLLDVGAHILYSPLPCQIPLPGFVGLRICISQYDQKERLLLRNLCFVLGAKYVERLTRKVTHLVCKFNSGPKYEAACKWKIKLVTCEWIYQCVKQNEVVGLDSYYPKEVTSQDQGQEILTVSQFTQSSTMMSNSSTQHSFQFQVPKDRDVQSIGKNKKARLMEGGNEKSDLPKKVHSAYRKTSMVEDVIPNGDADVAAAIEDLIVETSKIQDLKSPRRNEQEKNLFPDRTIEEKTCLDSSFDFSKNWINRDGRKDENCNPSVDGSMGKYNYDGFSETQTESQVVGYEEDLSGRQMIIDRVRTTRGF